MNACCVYDFTINCDHVSLDKLKEWCRSLCKKWCFQKEKGESGYIHYQGRISLKTKVRLTNLKSKCIQGMHVSITSDENKDNNFYVSKDDTRIEGPWSDKEDVVVYIPRQIREIEKWRPWQLELFKYIGVWDTRSIHVIIDEHGNKGKSIFCTAIGSMQKGCQIPYCNDFKDIMRMVMDMPKLGCYCIDLPRAINKEKLFQMYSGIEIIKSGYAYDDRYKFECSYFDCPTIFVFTNKVPDLTLLSRDRWILWEINAAFELKRFSGAAL